MAKGLGCVAINNIMEDAATMEISRSQQWQWIRNDVTTDIGLKVDMPYVAKLIAEE